MPVVQRFRQGIRALFAFTQSVDFELAEQYLNQQQMILFRQMARPEQLHSLNVLRDVLAQEDKTPHDLAVAALMHDSGKLRRHLAVWQKTITVLIAKFIPKLDDTLSAEAGFETWRAPFVVRRHHPKWSAEFLKDTGASGCAIWLAQHHADDATDWHNHPYYDLLIRLKRADDAN